HDHETRPTHLFTHCDVSVSLRTALRALRSPPAGQRCVDLAASPPLRRRLSSHRPPNTPWMTGIHPAHPRVPVRHTSLPPVHRRGAAPSRRIPGAPGRRSEEHTSELQSRENLVCRLLLEKKKNKR